MAAPAYKCPFKVNAGAGITCEAVACGMYNVIEEDCNIIMVNRRRFQLLGKVVPSINIYSSSSSSSSSNSNSSSSSSSSISSSSSSSSSFSNSSSSSSSSSFSSSSSSSSRNAE